MVDVKQFPSLFRFCFDITVCVIAVSVMHYVISENSQQMSTILDGRSTMKANAIRLLIQTSPFSY